MANKVFNPEGIPIPRDSYSQVAITKPGRIVFIPGNTACGPKGKTVGCGDVRAQTREEISKLVRGVEAVGGTKEDLVSLTVFTTDAR